MGKKIKRIIYVLVLSVVITGFSLSAAFLAIVQTKWGQTKIKTYVADFAKKNDLNILIGEITGNFPFNFVIKNLEIELKNSQKIKINDLSFSLSFPSLLVKKVKFKKIKIDTINIIPIERNPTSSSEVAKEFNLPFDLSFKSIKINKIQYEDMIYSTHGKIFLQKNLKNLYVNLYIIKESLKDSYLNLIIKGSKKEDFAEITLKAKTDSLNLFQPLINSTKTFKLKFFAKSTSSWQFLENLLLLKKTDKKLFSSGQGYGYFSFDNFEKYNLDKINFGLTFDLYEDFSGTLRHLFLENNFLKLQGKALFSSNFNLKNLELDFNTADLSLFNNISKKPLKGTFSGKILSSQNDLSVIYKAKNLKIDRYPVSLFEGSLLSKKENSSFSGQISSNLITLGEQLSLSSHFSYKFKEALTLNNFSITAPSFDVVSNLQIQSPFRITGKSSAHFNNLNLTKEFISHYDLNSIVDLTAEFNHKDGIQTGDFNLLFTNYHLNDLLGEKINLFFQVTDLFKNPKYTLVSEALNIRLNKLKIESLFFKTSNKEQINPYEIILNGKWRNPLEFKSNGFWSFDKNNFNLNLEKIEGTFLNNPYTLIAPTTLILGKDLVSLKNIALKMEDSSLNANIYLSDTESEIKVLAEHLPIDFLSFNPLEISVSGFSSFEGSLSQKGSDLQGHLDIDIEEMLISTIDEENPLATNGKMVVNLDNHRLKTKGKLQSETDNLLEIDTDIPIDLSLIPFNFKINKQAPLKAELALSGNLENFFNFINIGNQRIEGKIASHFSVSQSFSSPLVQGFCKLENGSYENYFTGTMLHDLNIELVSNNHHLILKSFKALGSNDGKITAQGQFDLRASRNYAYNLTVNLDDVLLFQTDLITASLMGDLQVKGNKKEAFVKGDVNINKAQFYIPEKIPHPMPILDVTFVNYAKEKLWNLYSSKTSYPIYLDIDVKSSDNIFIQGRGVNAQLKGEVKINGTYTEVNPKGQLDLVKGSYSFAGKYFDLKEGSIIFIGEPKTVPNISIKAETTQQGILLIASLIGPLNAPVLSFSSSPPLSLSSIVSLLIFGKDLSGISALQALQVATTIAALSEGGGVLETTKKSLGIDRLAVVSTTGEDTDNPDQIAVEVGKYITRGLLVSFKQGIEEGTTNASAEIDIGWGFIFQFETLQEEEQTRFTLKWGHNF